MRTMARDVLSCFGLVFLTLIILIGVGSVVFFYDQLGMAQIPKGVIETPVSYFQSKEIDIEDLGIGKVEWTNPLEALPTATATRWATPTQPATPTPLPAATATPWPTVDPSVYQTEAVIRLKQYVKALEDWLEANQDLSDNPEMRGDPQWRAKMEDQLDEVAAAGHALAVIGIPPAPYAVMDEWLVKVGDESALLRQNYRQALDSGDPAAFQAAGENFIRIKEYLTAAVDEMVAAGWSLE